LGDKRLQAGCTSSDGGGFYGGLNEGSSIKLVDGVSLSSASGVMMAAIYGRTMDGKVSSEGRQTE